MKRYTEITGFFDYTKTFEFLVSNIPDRGRFVECGAWLGKSSSFLCDLCNSTNKNIDLWIVDSWLGSSNELNTSHKLATMKDIYQIFLDNMGSRKFNHIRGLSQDVNKFFADKSCDVVFIDMEHTYKAVKNDIQMWLPKIKSGGFLAGHDYMAKQWKEDVQKAVHESFGDKINIISQGANACWIYKNDT